MPPVVFCSLLKETTAFGINQIIFALKCSQMATQSPFLIHDKPNIRKYSCCVSIISSFMLQNILHYACGVVMKKLIVLCIYFTTIIPHLGGTGNWNPGPRTHFSQVITNTSQITSLTFVYTTVYSGADQRKHQNSASLAFVGDWWIPRT